MFAKRSTFDLEPTRLTKALERRRRSGAALIDLTSSNPTACGFSHPGVESLESLNVSRALSYAPSALGLAEARAAVAKYEYERSAAAGQPAPARIDTARIVITASTSEAYGYLFKLLGDDGDNVLVPRPTYPLFDYLAHLEGLAIRPHALDESGAWSIDLAALEGALDIRSRIVLLVSPNNPTGRVVTQAELEAVDRIAAAHGTAVIIDEVFADFPLTERDPYTHIVAERQALTFRLSGLSKVCGLPHFKCGWIVVDGPTELAEGAIDRLSVIADTYLSVATPVQCALEALLPARHAFQDECRARLRRNLATLRRAAANDPAIQVAALDGGWYASLRVPRLASEEQMALQLLDEHGVVVHPGYLFGFPHEAFLVVSLLVEPSQFEAGIARVFEHAVGSDPTNLV